MLNIPPSLPLGETEGNGKKRPRRKSGKLVQVQRLQYFLECEALQTAIERPGIRRRANSWADEDSGIDEDAGLLVDLPVNIVSRILSTVHGRKKR